MHPLFKKFLCADFDLESPRVRQSRAHLRAKDPTANCPDIKSVHALQHKFMPGDMLFTPALWWHHVEIPEAQNRQPGLFVSLSAYHLPENADGSIRYECPA
jgi:hypothetical protein